MSKQENSDLLLWEIEESNPGLGKKVREKLRDVKDPEIGMDIIQLGLIRKVQLADDAAKVTMILTTPYCPYGPMLMEAARKKVEEVTGKKTEIIYGQEAWDRSMMEEGSGFNWGLF